MKKTNWILILLLLAVVNTYSQDSSEVKTKAFQLSFVPPLSTNGMDNINHTNKVSFNIIAGASGGLDGVEVGGLANIIKGNTKGTQLSGFCNVNKGTVNGIQMAGFSNVVTEDFQGIQLAGFNNYAKSATGAQISGFLNTATGSTDATQISGFLNVAADTAKGMQLAGFSNIATKDYSGVQISSFLNRARKVKGAQIGFINLCDSIQGVPVGFFSFVKHGYHKFEVNSNETFQSVVSFKTGVNKFYNIFSAGARWTKTEPVWVVGYGIGSEFKLSPKMNLNLDAISYAVLNNMDGYEDNWSSINKLHLAVSYTVQDRFSLFAGPTFNVTVKDNNYDNTTVEPWQTYTKVYDNTTVIMYPGFNAGIRF